MPDRRVERVFRRRALRRRVLRALARSFDPDRAGGFTGIIAFELVDGGGDGEVDVWSLAVEGGRATAHAETPSRPTLTITTGVASVVRVAAGQMELSAPLAEGQATVRGNLLWAARLDEMFTPARRPASR